MNSRAKLFTAGSLMGLLLSTSVVIIGGMNNVEAQETGSSDVSAASGSNRFVVWQDDGDIYFRRSTDDGATWQATKNLSNNQGASVNTLITVTGSNIYVIWGQFNSENALPNIFFRSSADNGATWGSKVKITSSGTVNVETYQLAASGSKVYVVWEDGTNEVYLRRSVDSGVTWRSTVNISSDGSKLSTDPDIAASGSNAYIVWTNHASDEIVLRRSADSGATWAAKVNLSNDPIKSICPTVAGSGSNVYAIWHSDGSTCDALPNILPRDVLFRRSADNGVTWKPVVNLSNNPEDSIEGSTSSKLALSGSNVFVVWEDSVQGDKEEPQAAEISFRRSTDNGATWKPEVNLSSNPGLSLDPQIAVSGTYVHVSWFQHNAEDTASDSFFRRSTNGGATWEAKINLSNTGAVFGGFGGPQVAASGSSVYAAWVDLSPGNREIFLRRSTDNGANWEATVNLSNNAGFSYMPQIGV